MTTLYLPVGPPGCGKTTVAATMVKLGIIPPEAVVCPDDYRKIITGTISDLSADAIVWPIVNKIVDNRLRYSLDVLEDATHCNALSVSQRFVGMAALDVNVTVIRFDVPLGECLARNSRRPNPVPSEVVQRMHERAQRVLDLAENNPAIKILHAQEIEEQQ